MNVAGHNVARRGRDNPRLGRDVTVLAYRTARVLWERPVIHWNAVGHGVKCWHGKEGEEANSSNAQ